MCRLHALLFAFWVATCGGAIAAQSDVPAVAAASDLKFALEETTSAFRAATQRDVKLVFGSSGNFYTQIGQGAPFQLFMSADESFVFKLADAGRTVTVPPPGN